MWTKLGISLLVGAFGLMASGAFAATFTPLTQKREERWESSLYRNDNTRQQFCAADAKEQPEDRLPSQFLPERIRALRVVVAQI